MFAGFYFWWPKWTGRMLNERLGYVHFWLLFIGFHMTFLIQHWLGVDGMVRRYADYSPQDGFTWGNQVSTVGAMILGVSMITFLLNIWITARKAPRSEEHTSELQSPMRISYDVFCLKKNITYTNHTDINHY